MAPPTESDPGGRVKSTDFSKDLRPSIQSGPLTALLVDDDDDLRVYLRRCLDQFEPLFGHVLETSSGTEALTVARTNHVDLMICSARLSVMGSVPLFNAVRADDGTASMLIMVIADRQSSHDEQTESVQSLADAVLYAPFNASGFADRLTVLLESAFIKRSS